MQVAGLSQKYFVINMLMRKPCFCNRIRGLKKLLLWCTRRSKTGQKTRRRDWFVRSFSSRVSLARCMLDTYWGARWIKDGLISSKTVAFDEMNTR
jgi:hypothetical protein